MNRGKAKRERKLTQKIGRTLERRAAKRQKARVVFVHPEQHRDLLGR